VELMDSCPQRVAPPPPTSVRQTWFFSEEALIGDVLSPTPNDWHIVQPGCPGLPAPPRSAPSQASALCRPPRTARWPVTDPVSRKNLCVRMRPYGPGSEIQTPSGTVLGVACRAWFFRHISVGSGGNIKLPSSPVN
jgi:hypothetical protein